MGLFDILNRDPYEYKTVVFHKIVGKSKKIDKEIGKWQRKGWEYMGEGHGSTLIGLGNRTVLKFRKKRMFR